jgi:putative nucleotidyltransferase with HDIG domain
LISDLDEVRQILKSGIREAWIDTDKGLDIDQPKQSEPASSPPPEAKVVATVPEPRIIVPASMEEELGRASRIVDKSKEAVYTMFSEARMGKAVNVDNAKELVEEISSSVMRNPGALIGLARLKTKDDYTYMHSVAVCALMVALAKQLGLDEHQTREAGVAGLLHDIGKMMVPGDILNKPGKLTDEEFISVKEHPAAGYKMLRDSEGVSEISLDVCLHHHEKIDGTGYPKGLKERRSACLREWARSATFTMQLRQIVLISRVGVLQSHCVKWRSGVKVILMKKFFRLL